MKTIEYYMNLPYRLELVPDTDEGGFVASYPELRGCLTSGETAEAALQNAQDCKREWLAAALEDGYEIPEPTSDDEYSGQFKLRLPKSLHCQAAAFCEIKVKITDRIPDHISLHILTDSCKVTVSSVNPRLSPASLVGVTCALQEKFIVIVIVNIHVI